MGPISRFNRLYLKKNNTYQVDIPKLVIDSHMHVQSSRCCPWPLLLKQSILSRDNLKSIAKHYWIITTSILGPVIAGIGYYFARNHLRSIKIGDNSTLQISKMAIGLSGQTFAKNKKSFGNVLMNIMVALPMDMEFGHISGYKGKTIYRAFNDDYYYRNRFWITEAEYQKALKKKEERIKSSYNPYLARQAFNVFDPVINRSIYKYEKGTMYYEATNYGRMKDETTESFHPYPMQIRETEQGALLDPWKILPMYHIDPRRYLGYGDNQQKLPNKIKKIATENTKGTFVGIKMYCSLGYSPDDKKIPFFKDLSFYRECAKKKIPILVHNSAEGLLTHELEFYYYHDKADFFTKVDALDTPQDHFRKKYVHPDNWERVLQKVPDLKLCLAHFGSDIWKYHTSPNGKLWQKTWVSKLVQLAKTYPNLYIDISYLLIKRFKVKVQSVLADKKLREKILFGTDWFMTELDGYNYEKFCKEVKKYLDGFSDVYNGSKEWRKNPYDPKVINLWRQFSYINPMRYYGLDSKKKVENLYLGFDEKFSKIAKMPIPSYLNKEITKLKNTSKVRYNNLLFYSKNLNKF